MMIYRLRKKFVLITAVSVGVVFSLVFCGICVVGRLQLNSSLDMLTDVIAVNNGSFPDFADGGAPDFSNDIINRGSFSPETQFSTRFFTVFADENGNITRQNIQHISSVSESQARDFAQEVLNGGKKRGWISDYRYKTAPADGGCIIVFVSGEANRAVTNGLLYSVLFVLTGSFLLILLLILLISKRAVKPAAESYEKQKQFVTDANHELKTPLTLILSNVDIVEAQTGKSEWLSDIRSEGERMKLLIDRLLTLSRMDEERSDLLFESFDLSEAAGDVVSEFSALAREKNKLLTADIEPSLRFCGDEGLIRRLLCILLDNAVKYCDANGSITVRVCRKGRRFVISVENSFKNVQSAELSRLFDRFYRADKARTFEGGFGIGLSIAKSIAEKHRGSISAYRKGADRIGFKVVLK